MRYCPTCESRFTNDSTFCPTDGTPLVVDDDVTQVVDPMLGQVVDGRYRIDRAIGQGGMGVVYLVTHVALNKRMALKVLRGEMARDGEVVARFIQEAQASTAIGHPNIIDISDFGRLPDGAVYFVMEYLDGEPLTDFIRRGGAIPAGEAIRIVRGIASALGAAHARGIVHRDLKPDNVFLVRSGDDPWFVKILDFGIAKVGGANSRLTRTGMVFGTPHYMSPEQAAGQAVDQRTDIYALGVIMYEMFTGQVPFDAETFMGILSKHMFEAPPAPSLSNGQLGDLEPLILRSLEKKPEDRYQTMDELLSDLDTVEGGGQVSIGAMGRPSAPAVFVRSEYPRAHVPEARPASSLKPLLVVGFVVALFVAGGLAGAAFALFGGADAPPPAAAARPGAPPAASPAPPPAAPSPVPPPSRRVAPPSPATEPATELAPAASVRIESEPSGAVVLADGVLVGNTPLQLPRPSGDESTVFSVRSPGHTEAQVRLSATSPDVITAQLEPETVARPARRRSLSPMTPSSPSDEPVTTNQSAMRRRSEVVDPWAN